MSLGERIKLKRKELRLTQKQLADKMGLDHTTISKWESDTYEPDSKSLNTLSKILSVSADYLLGTEKHHDDSSPIPSSVKTFLRADTSGLTKKDQEILAEDLADYFAFRKNQLLNNKKNK